MKEIGKGAAGIVFEARHRETGVTFALKILTEQGQETLLRRFEQEFRTASRLDHPNVVRAVEFGEADGFTYLVMEYVEGESLGEKVERHGPLPEATAIDLAVQISQGLHYAHQHGIIHRDVKPDNVRVTPQGHAKLTDLGLVKELISGEDLTKTGRGLGTPHFMAPEQFRDAKNVDPRSDVYALGATLYVLVTGQLPFAKCSPMECWVKKVDNELPRPRSLVPTLSERTDRAIRLAMAPNPDDRPPSMPDFVQKLIGRPMPQMEQQPSEAKSMHVLYSDREGQTYALRLPMNTLRQWLAAGRLANARDVRGSHQVGGPFLPLETFEEFRGLPLPKEEAPPPPSRSNRETTQIERPAARTRPTPTIRPDGEPSSTRVPTWGWMVLAVLVALAVGFVVFPRLW